MGSLSYITVFLTAAVLASATVVKPASIEGNFELLILHNNDMHARFEQTSQLSGTCTTADRDAGKCYGGFPRVAHVVKEARKAAATGQGPPVLYLNAGDTYTGTAWFTIYKWQIAAEFLNALQPDAVSLGNHEFDEVISGLVPFIRNLTTPVLAANLILDNVPELINEKNLMKSIVIVKNGVRIGIIGYLTPDTKILAPKTNMEYEDEIIAIKREVKNLKLQGVKILIALGHSGFIKDLEIAKKVQDIDLVIGGHSNTFLLNEKSTQEKPEVPEGPYPVIVKQDSGRKVPVVQAYAYTKYMGKLHLIFDYNGEIIQVNGDPILLDQQVPRDSELLEVVNKYRDSVYRLSEAIVGVSETSLNGLCRLHECNLGDFITDSILHYTKKYYNNTYHDANIAVIQSGRIRTSIDQEKKPFQLTRGDWLNVIPFEDTLVILTMNGSVLLKALEHSIAMWQITDSRGQFLQMSGMTVVYDLSKEPGHRVIEAKAICSNCNNPNLEAIQESFEYKVIMPLFISDGGDGYNLFVDLPRELVPYTEMVCLLDYLNEFKSINPQVSNRIKIINEPKVSNVVSQLNPNGAPQSSLCIMCYILSLLYFSL